MGRRCKRYLALALSAALILQGQVMTVSATSGEFSDVDEIIADVSEESVSDDVVSEETLVENSEDVEESIAETTVETSEDEYNLIDENTVEIGEDAEGSLDETDAEIVEEGAEKDLLKGDSLKVDFDKDSILGAPGTISTTVAGDQFIIDEGVLKKYYGSNETIIIPDGVTTIGTEAFRGKNTIKSVVIPFSVTRIDSYAFMDCENLEKVDFGRVKTIGRNAFQGCVKIKELVFQEGLEEIGFEAFLFVNARKIVLPDSVKVIEDYAFLDNMSIDWVETEDITLPKGLEKIGVDAFGHRIINRVIVPENALSNTTILEDAFGYSQIYNLYFEDGTKEIPSLSTTDHNIQSVYIPESVNKIGKIGDDSTQMVIIGKDGSYAQEYAKNHRCYFVRQ